MPLPRSSVTSRLSTSSELAAKLKCILPGVFLVAVVSGSAYSMRGFPALAIFTPMILAVIVGMIFANIVEVPRVAAEGIAFCQRSILRFAIVLLGFQLTFTQIQMVGIRGFVIAAVSLVATFIATLGMARFLGVERKLAELIAAGTSVCGASAIVASSSVTNAKDEDVAYAVATITLFGTIAMFTYPLLMPVLGLSSADYGLWAGAAIHEVAQVVGAGFQVDAEAGEISTIAKLARVVMLAPLVLALGYLGNMRQSGNVSARIPVPWFVFGFLAVVMINSMVSLPEDFLVTVPSITTFMLTMGLAAMGLKTNVAAICATGVKPLLVAFAASIFIAAVSFGLIKVW